MIIGISGKAGSGKDTIGKIIQAIISKRTNEEILEDLSDYQLNEWWLEETSVFHIKKFATKLKQIISILTGIPVWDLEKQEVKENTYVNYLTGEVKQKKDIKYLNFIETVEQLEEVLQTTSLNFWVKVRVILQYEGTQIGRYKRGENSWVNALFADYKEHKPPKGNTFDYTHSECIDCKKPFYGYKRQFICNDCYDKHDWYPNWIITDLRFPNELQAIKDRGGFVIRVNRYVNNPLDKAHGLSVNAYLKAHPTQEHPSETALDDYKNWDEIIDNNGTIEELIEKTRNFLTKINII